MPRARDGAEAGAKQPPLSLEGPGAARLAGQGAQGAGAQGGLLPGVKAKRSRGAGSWGGTHHP